MQQLKEQLSQQEQAASARASAAGGGGEAPAHVLDDATAAAIAQCTDLVSQLKGLVEESIEAHKSLFDAHVASGQSRRALQAMQLKLQVRNRP